MDALDALLDYVKAVSPLLAAATGVKLTGDCATDVGAIAAKMDVKYDGPSGLPDALVACLGKLGSDFDDAKKRDIMNAVDEKNATRVMQELGKTYRFKKTTPCFRVSEKKKVTWPTKLTPAAVKQLEEQEARGEYGVWPTAMDKDESSSDEEEAAAAPAGGDDDDDGEGQE